MQTNVSVAQMAGKTLNCSAEISTYLVILNRGDGNSRTTIYRQTVEIGRAKA